MEESVTEEDFECERHEIEPPLRTREEVAYYRIFAENLGEVSQNVPSAASPRRSHPAGGPNQIRGQRSSPRRSSAQGGSYVR